MDLAKYMKAFTKMQSWTLLIAACTLAGSAWAQSPGTTVPDDTTPGLPLVEKDPNAKDKGAEQDDATNRREWQKQAWGTVTLSFRRSAIQEGYRHTRRLRHRGDRLPDRDQRDGTGAARSSDADVDVPCELRRQSSVIGDGNGGFGEVGLGGQRRRNHPPEHSVLAAPGAVPDQVRVVGARQQRTDRRL